MSRKDRSPEENACRTKIRGLLQESNFSSMENIQYLFKETIAEKMIQVRNPDHPEVRKKFLIRPAYDDQGWYCDFGDQTTKSSSSIAR